MRIAHYVRLTVLLLWLSLGFSSQVTAQNASCFSPGTLVASDPEDLPIVGFHDIEKVYISEPYSSDGVQKIVFSLKVRNLRPNVPLAPLPLGTWNIMFSGSSGPSRYVQMSTLVGNPVLKHGTVTTILGLPVFIEIGSIFGNHDNNGMVTFTVDKAAVGNPSVGSNLTISSKTFVNTIGIGLVQLDESSPVNYTILGNGTCAPFNIAPFGLNGDIPVTSDYNRNGTHDFSVWRPSTGTWYSIDSVTGAFSQTQHGSGPFGDVPVAGHFDNDINADATVYRPSTGDWLIRSTETGTTRTVRFGLAEDLPSPGDFDGDQIDDIAVFRPSNGTWYILNSADSSVRIDRFGLSEDRPVVGDYDGDRRDDIAVFRPSLGDWYYLKSSTSLAVGIHFGAGTDVAVPGDYDGDGKTDVAVWRPETGVWYMYQSFSQTVGYGFWGLSTDRVQPGDYNGNGRSDLAVWRPETGVWYIHYR